jgi:hypothetical protein
VRRGVGQHHQYQTVQTERALGGGVGELVCWCEHVWLMATMLPC